MNTLKPLLILFNSSIRSLNNGLRLIFSILYLVTKPNLLLIRVIQFIKSKPFSILLLGASAYLVMRSTLETSPVLLRKFFPELPEQAILARAYFLAVFSEVALIVLKLQKKKIWAFLVMLLVVSFSLGGLFYDVIINFENYPLLRVIAIGLFQGSPTLISIILLWSSGNDASKVAKYQKFDKAFTGKKKSRDSMSKEEREALYKQILEHVDYHYQANKEALSMNSIKEAFNGRVKSSATVSRLLNKERPLVYAYIKDNVKAGRKQKGQTTKGQIEGREDKQGNSSMKTKVNEFMKGFGFNTQPAPEPEAQPEPRKKTRGKK